MHRPVPTLALAACLLLGLQAQAQVEDFIAFLNSNNIPISNPGTPIAPSLLVTGTPPRARIFFVGVVGHLGQETIEEADGTVLFTVFGGGKDFHPISNPTGGLIPAPAPVDFVLSPSSATVRFDPLAVLSGFGADDLGNPGAPFEPGDFVYVTLYVNGDGQINKDGNGCLPIANFSYGMHSDLVSFPGGIPVPSVAGLTITAAGDDDNSLGSNFGSGPAISNPSVVLSSQLSRFFGFFLPPIPSVGGGNAVPQPSGLCGPNPPPEPPTLPHTRRLFLASPFGPCTGFTTMEASNAAVLQMAAMVPCSFPRFRCTGLSIEPVSGPPGTPVTIRMTVENQGNLVGTVNAAMGVNPPGSIQFTSPTEVAVTIEAPPLPSVFVTGPNSTIVQFTGMIAPGAMGQLSLQGSLNLNAPAGVPYNQAPFGTAPFEVLLPSKGCTKAFQVDAPAEVVCERLTASTDVITPGGSVNFTLVLRNTTMTAGTVHVLVTADPASGFQQDPLFTQNDVVVPPLGTTQLLFTRSFSLTPPTAIAVRTTLTPVPPTRVPVPSPASCAVSFRGGGLEFCSQTQGGWGQECSGNNVGCFRDRNFATVFPNGLRLGDQAGPNGPGGGFTLLLTSAAAVEAFLPSGSTPGALTGDLTDPVSPTPAGVLGGQLAAAMLNVAFDAAGLRRQGTFPHPPGTLGRLIYVGCVDADLIGLSVNEVLERANRAIAGQGLPPGVSFSDLVDALTRVNEGFVDCRGNGGGCFRLP